MYSYIACRLTSSGSLGARGRPQAGAGVPGRRPFCDGSFGGLRRRGLGRAQEASAPVGGHWRGQEFRAGGYRVIAVRWRPRGRDLVRTDMVMPHLLPSIGAGLGDMPPSERLLRMGLPLANGEGPAERDQQGHGVTDNKSSEEEKQAPAKPPGESGADGGAKSEVGKPFVLSEGLPPVPHKLAARIMRGSTSIWRSSSGTTSKLRGELPAHRLRHRAPPITRSTN